MILEDSHGNFIFKTDHLIHPDIHHFTNLKINRGFAEKSAHLFIFMRFFSAVLLPSQCRQAELYAVLGVRQNHRRLMYVS